MGVSRASHEATIYTDDKIQLPDSVRQWQSKESALDYEKSLNFENGKHHDDHFERGSNEIVRLEKGHER